MSRKPDCPFHPGVPADTPCKRCGRLYCPDCVRDWNGTPLGPVCRRARQRRRLLIAGVVALMFAGPAAAIVWGLDQRARYGKHRHRIQQRKKLLKKYPQAAGVRLRLAQDLLRAGRVAEARRELDRLLKKHPHHLGGLLARAEVARRTSDREGVLRYTSRALIAAPRSVAIRLQVSRAQVGVGRPDKAAEVLRLGLKANPAAVELSLELARQLTAAHRVSDARQVLSEALSRARSPADKKRLTQALGRLPGSP